MIKFQNIPNRMSKIISYMLCFILVIIVSIIVKWWACIPICFVLSYLYEKKRTHAFGAYFLIVSTIWLILTLIADNQFDKPMSQLISELFGQIHTNYVFLLVWLLGGVLGGWSALMGTWTKLYVSSHV